MRALNHKRQRGYVLILTLLMFMGIGGVVMANFTKEARRDLETQKYAHNRQVLAEAKQALLMYAYNYPANNPGRGPGRLPCPDTDDDGDPNPSLNCINGVAIVGRLPWDDPDLDFYDIRDASGERLWYVVSSNFANTKPVGTDVINSDTTGTITLIDRSGQVLYDGDGAGLAAIIIAPGTRLRRDNDADGIYETEQVRQTVAQRNDPQNYLDTFTPFVGVSYDNSFFLNGSSVNDADGLLQGQVLDTAQSDIVVNDQMIIITADEVIAMAEKAVAETYRNAITVYQETLWPGAPGNFRYPWLSAYDDTNDLNIYNPLPGETSGRVPFIDYFVDDNSPHEVIVGNLEIDYDLHVSHNSMVDNNDPFDPTYIDAASSVIDNYPESDQTVRISNARISFSRTSFSGAADTTADNLGTMIVRDSGTSVVTPLTWPSNTARRYFWDGCDDGGGTDCDEVAIPVDGWELCDNGGLVPGDCAKDDVAPYGFEAFSGDWNNHANIQVRMIEFQYVDADFVIELDYLPAPVVTAPTVPTAADHARFQVTFNENEVTTMAVVDPAEPDTRNFFDIKVSMCDQDSFVGTDLNLVSLGNADGGTIACSVDLVLDVTTNYHDPLVFRLDWYPPLPRWIADNNWDDSVMMSYMPDFAPGGDGGCTPDADLATPVPDDCLVVNNQSGVNNGFNALLVVAGEHDLVDGDDLNGDGDFLDADEDPPDNDFSNDLQDIFEPENYSGLWPHPVPNNDPDVPSDSTLPRIFDKREDAVPGNSPDTLFVIN